MQNDKRDNKNGNRKNEKKEHFKSSLPQHDLDYSLLLPIGKK
jgi:hypothetical protein